MSSLETEKKASWEAAVHSLSACVVQQHTQRNTFNDATRLNNQRLAPKGLLKQLCVVIFVI